MEDDRIIGCLPGETPASIVAGYQALQNARLAAHVNELESALANAHARVVELERMVVWAVEHGAMFILNRMIFDDDGFQAETQCVGTPASILAAVAEAMGGK